ncbi:MAG: hypothetical protein JSR60_18700 [Proteobacteria bacterium]|nr:hypothetical protein [Pseudomonadota bacterium]
MRQTTWNSVTRHDKLGELLANHRFRPRNPHEVVVQGGIRAAAFAATWGARAVFSKVYKCNDCNHASRVWFE